MAGVRDRLIHEYFGVNLDIVWQIAKMELPKVIDQLAGIDQSVIGITCGPHALFHTDFPSAAPRG